MVPSGLVTRSTGSRLATITRSARPGVVTDLTLASRAAPLRGSLLHRHATSPRDSPRANDIAVVRRLQWCHSSAYAGETDMDAAERTPARTSRVTSGTPGPDPARPRHPRVRAPLVEVRRRQGAGGPREVRHVAPRATTRCSTPSSTVPRPSRPTRCWCVGCAACAPPASASAPPAASASSSEPTHDRLFPAPVPHVAPPPPAAVTERGVAFPSPAGDAQRHRGRDGRLRLRRHPRRRSPPSARITTASAPATETPTPTAEVVPTTPSRRPRSPSRRSSAARSTSRSTTTPASRAWPPAPPPRPPRSAGRSSARTTGTAPSRPPPSTTRPASRPRPSCSPSTWASSRTAPAVEPMRMDRLTVILTADAA